jgi:hypothetical protein
MSSEIVAILVPPGRQAEISAEHSEATATLDQLREWPCLTPQDETDLAEILGVIKDKAKDLEEKRTTITGPLNAAKRAVDALFRPARDALEEAERIIKGKLAQADRRREEARRAAQLQLQAAAQAAQVNPAALSSVKAAQAQLAATPQPGTTGAPEGVSFRYQWKWDLEDIGQVPTEFLALNPATLKMYVSRFKDQDQIPPVPGITFRRERIVVAGG